jgi:hypothetical protein
MSVENIQLKLKQKIKIKRSGMRGCSFLPGGRMVLSSWSTNTVTFINKDGEELFQIGKDQTGSDTYDTVYIKDNNSVAVSSGIGDKQCITIIDIERKEVMTTISIDTLSYGMAVRGRTIFYCARGNGLKMLNLSHKSVINIINSDMSYIFCMAHHCLQRYHVDFLGHVHL